MASSVDREIVRDMHRYRDALVSIISAWDAAQMPMPAGLVGHVTQAAYDAAQREMFATYIDAARAELAAPTWVTRMLEVMAANRDIAAGLEAKP